MNNGWEDGETEKERRNVNTRKTARFQPSGEKRLAHGE